MYSFALNKIAGNISFVGAWQISNAAHRNFLGSCSDRCDSLVSATVKTELLKFVNVIRLDRTSVGVRINGYFDDVFAALFE